VLFDLEERITAEQKRRHVLGFLAHVANAICIELRLTSMLQYGHKNLLNILQYMNL
jgi:hypothetical protein